uniref:Uncharacterized protein n=1 Tax=Knipowitschia caucasica TaxID=637954 RepID=A0AAV2K985_KNICA
MFERGEAPGRPPPPAHLLLSSVCQLHNPGSRPLGGDNKRYLTCWSVREVSAVVGHSEATLCGVCRRCEAGLMAVNTMSNAGAAT